MVRFRLGAEARNLGFGQMILDTGSGRPLAMHASRVKWAPLLLFCLTVAGGYLLASNAVPAEAITGPGSGRMLAPTYEWQAVAGSWRLCI